jgi:hypothetical protein
MWGIPRTLQGQLKGNTPALQGQLKDITPTLQSQFMKNITHNFAR